MPRYALAGLGVALLLATAAAAEDADPRLFDDYCRTCHNDDTRVGSFSLDPVDLSEPARHAEALEKVILKLRAGMMPPAGMPRPPKEDVARFVSVLETAIDRAAAEAQNPGRPVLHRLNRTEYENVIRDLLGLEVDAARLLPPDTMSEGYDNMSDVLTISPSLLEGYISAAGKLSRLAVGDPDASPRVETYVVPVTFTQLRHVEGAPFGTRGGLAVLHNFPADGDYVFRLSFYYRTLGPLFGDNKPAEGERIEVAIDGERVALFDIDRKIKQTADLRTPPIHIAAGPRVVSASFLPRFDGPVQDFVMPFEQATADLTTGNVQGLTGLPHLRNIGIDGPYDVTGVSETPSRRKIFVCRPPDGASRSEARACAERIVSGLARKAFRRPVTKDDVAPLLALFDCGYAEAGFDSGIRVALQAVLADPELIFRFERTPEGVAPGTNYRVSDVELASRLAFFLWSRGPDDELLDVAARGELSRPDVLERQVRRMLADERASALSTSFAAHWLHLQNLDDVHPDVYRYPNWDLNLTRSMRKETLLLFGSIVREDRSIVDLLSSDTTFVDGRLARHYGIPNVVGNRFRRVPVASDARRGILGHGSILTLTSLANRTSPVIRGAWVLEVLLGTPPPRPPANVPPLKENASGERALSVRERIEEHRKNPACSSCHGIMDPIGFSLENFDPVGAWRWRDSGYTIDPSGVLFDGTEVSGPGDLRAYLLGSQDLFVRNFTRNLLMYGLGRVLKPFDMPAVRRIAADAALRSNRFSAFVLGVVRSVPFTMRGAPAEGEGVTDAPVE